MTDGVGHDDNGAVCGRWSGLWPMERSVADGVVFDSGGAVRGDGAVCGRWSGLWHVPHAAPSFIVVIDRSIVV